MKKMAFIILLACALCVMAQKPQVVAHRGYWDAPGSAQNSIRALIKADSIGCDAVELDVWITADDCLVVNHDPSIEGIVIEGATMAMLDTVRLGNGEPLPTLEQYLDTAATLSIPLVIELKPHSTPSREELAADMIIAMVESKGLTDRSTFITFSNHAVEYLASRSQRPVYALTAQSPAELKALGGAGADFNLRSLRAHPEWIAQFKEEGVPINVWTVNKEEDLLWCIEQGFDYITTNDPELAQRLILSE